MQDDFGHECGMFAHAGIDIAPIQKVVPPTRATVPGVPIDDRPPSNRSWLTVVWLPAYAPVLANRPADDLRLLRRSVGNGSTGSAAAPRLARRVCECPDLGTGIAELAGGVQRFRRSLNF